MNDNFTNIKPQDEQIANHHTHKTSYTNLKPIIQTRSRMNTEEFDNSANHLNKSEEYNDIMSKINKVAESVQNLEEIKIFDKYIDLSENQIKKEIKRKK